MALDMVSILKKKIIVFNSVNKISKIEYGMNTSIVLDQPQRSLFY